MSLANASDLLGGAPNCRRFLGVWQEWRRGRAVPTRQDFRPEALGPLLGAISIFEIEAPDRVVVRLLSSDIERFSGRSAKGENFVERVRPEDRAERIARHQRLIRTPCGAITLTKVGTESRLFASLRSLLLPVARDETSPPSFIYSAGDIDGEKDWVELPVSISSSLAREFIHVDIGYGLPPEPT